MKVFQIAYCITAHGFGHAARAAAVMESLSRLIDVHYSIVTTVPVWFFQESLTASFTVHPVQVDVGLVQRSALEIDLPGTCHALEDFYGSKQNTIGRLCSLIKNCQLVIGDIAPITFPAARKVGIPSVLLENFTWDWIYETYRSSFTEFETYINTIRQMYSLADYRIQAEPLCLGQPRDLLTAPIARKIRSKRADIRRKLGVENAQHLVLISMGGEGISHLPLNVLEKYPDTVFLLSGLKKNVPVQGNSIILEKDSGFFHPDLVAAADTIVGKVGYSTLAEAYHCGTPFAYIARENFRESLPLVQFIKEHMAGVQITEKDFIGGNWDCVLQQRSSIKVEQGKRKNGADQCADFIASLLKTSGSLLK